MQIIIELITQDNNIMWKVFTTTSHKSTRLWYHNLKPKPIIDFGDLYPKLFSRFSTSIPTKKNTIEIFTIT